MSSSQLASNVDHGAHVQLSARSARPVGVAAGADMFPCRGLGVWRVTLTALIVVGSILLNKFGTVGNAIFYVIVVVTMLASPLGGLAGMNVAVLALISNTAFVEKTAIWTLSRFITTFLFVGRFVGGGAGFGWLTSPSYIAFLTYCGTAAVCSLLGGVFVHIALLKLLFFFLTLTGFFACIYTLRRLRIDTTEWFVAQGLVLCILSALALALGVGANFRDLAMGVGLYNLAVYHPQAMGPLAAILCTYVICVLLFAGHRNRWICLPILGVLVFCILLTRSRTGVGTLLFGVLSTVGPALLWGGRGSRAIRVNVSRSSLLAATVAATFLFVLADVGSRGAISDVVRSFAVKATGSVESFTVEDVISSRIGKISDSWESFQASPVYGIGFQVSRDPYFRQHATIFHAPVEKGFLPTAVLEETGVIGALFFLIFIGTMLWSLVHQRNVPGLAVFSTFLVMNLGEVCFFSLAGHGAYAWMLVAGGILLGDRCRWAVRLPSRGRIVVMPGQAVSAA